MIKARTAMLHSLDTVQVTQRVHCIGIMTNNREERILNELLQYQLPEEKGDIEQHRKKSRFTAFEHGLRSMSLCISKYRTWVRSSRSPAGQGFQIFRSGVPGLPGLLG
jgi:hypothetical protein